jgi:sodium/hydrogen antiporter
VCLCLGVCLPSDVSNDSSGWFSKKTEESHVSNVIDLLFNLAFFVYYGSIIPWSSMNSPELTIVPWRLVVIAILILLFRRIPIMLALKPVIPDIHTWREALFCGHFGPIGVGAIFISILARAELETGEGTPLAQLPTDPSTPNYILIQSIWPIVSFLILSSVPFSFNIANLM